MKRVSRSPAAVNGRPNKPENQVVAVFNPQRSSRAAERVADLLKWNGVPAVALRREKLVAWVSVDRRLHVLSIRPLRFGEPLVRLTIDGPGLLGLVGDRTRRRLQVEPDEFRDDDRIRVTILDVELDVVLRWVTRYLAIREGWRCAPEPDLPAGLGIVDFVGGYVWSASAAGYEKAKRERQAQRECCRAQARGVAA